MTDRTTRIRERLAEVFEPKLLEVTDESAAHAGHAGARPEGETHFNVLIVSNAFEGLSRVARHQAVNEALAEEFETGLHALSIKAIPPPET
ncbi:MAG: BolA family transcriptional regulator [Pseudomonadota bacterium]